MAELREGAQARVIDASAAQGAKSRKPPFADGALVEIQTLTPRFAKIRGVFGYWRVSRFVAA